MAEKYETPANENTLIYKDYIGRTKIKINVSKEQLLKNPVEIVKENISTILGIHEKNKRQIKYLKKFYKGWQDIYKKKRANGSDKINNFYVENYAWQFVNFKKGYYIGTPIQYVKVTEETDDYMTIFNNCIKDSHKASKDLDKYEDVLVSGIAYTLTIPKQEDYEEGESPFEYYVLDNENTLCVYSTDVKETLLFSMVISTIKGNNNTEYQVYTIYYDDNVFYLSNKTGLVEVYTSNDEEFKITKMPIKQPITEYTLNKSRMGCFEPVLNSLNNMNVITANQIDQIEEAVNAYIIFENQNVDFIKSNIDTFRAKRFICVKTNNPNTPAKVSSINIQLDQTSVNNLYERLEQRAFDIVGVPMATSSTGQGVSGEAQVFGGGWENAQTIANVDTQYLSQFELQDLKKFVSICKSSTIYKMKDFAYNNIDVKYTINKSNNMLVKSQTFKYYVDLGMTVEKALELAEITNDSHQVAKEMEKNIKQKEQEQIDLEIEKAKKIKELENQYTQTQTEDIK